METPIEKMNTASVIDRKSGYAKVFHNFNHKDLVAITSWTGFTAIILSRNITNRKMMVPIFVRGGLLGLFVGFEYVLLTHAITKK